ncbi:MAG: type II toxin-antitoxin system PemK/MazF family toxin [Paraclostridium bifermentans]|uniref:type II toxin-antitoxin system PemK/MazF family toxin n=1 Tax=Paraclostridium bifermentans TaxID=1490 RepID=UPI001DA86196|nr:type II toxin-antitoxin system PemK/MazF family toxin [Paraclostridium bifermentans]MBS6509720.1 type II toxin-antitoxin system PemK/MazF family toxin [Paraclostridium bifermentans]
MKRDILKGDIYYADLTPTLNCEHGGVRPVLIVQSDAGNKYSPTTIVCAITSQINTAKLPTHVKLNADNFNNLKKDSVLLAEQIRTINRERLQDYIGHLDDITMLKVRKALFTSFGEENCLK